MYLLDTNVISVGAPSKAVRPVGLVRWMDRNSHALYLSVVTLAEIEDGIAKVRREGAVRKADRLAEWLLTVVHLYGRRFLPVDVPVARRIGALSDRARSCGAAPGFADLAIAATAQSHGHTVLTRNMRHFRALDVGACDPFETLPAEA